MTTPFSFAQSPRPQLAATDLPAWGARAHTIVPAVHLGPSRLVILSFGGHDFTSHKKTTTLTQFLEGRRKILVFTHAGSWSRLKWFYNNDVKIVTMTPTAEKKTDRKTNVLTDSH